MSPSYPQLLLCASCDVRQRQHRCRLCLLPFSPNVTCFWAFLRYCLCGCQHASLPTLRLAILSCYVVYLYARMCRPVLHLHSGRMEWIGPMEQQFMEVWCVGVCALSIPLVSSFSPGAPSQDTIEGRRHIGSSIVALSFHVLQIKFKFGENMSCISAVSCIGRCVFIQSTNKPRVLWISSKLSKQQAAT